MQSALILHHYASSPFSEKVRLAFGIKSLSWHSVEIAPQPPRPLLAPMTGGYRRVPVLQIGADIYCDTNIILPALERLFPGPTLYRGGPGLVQALAFNFERTIWLAAIGVAVHFAKGEPPDDFLRDRKEDYLYVDMSKAAMEPDFWRNTQRVRAQVAWLVDALADGRRFLLGDAPCTLDLAYFHALWLIRERGGSKPDIDAHLGLGPIVPWYDRVAAIGHGAPTPMKAETALDIAKTATPAPVTHVAVDGDPDGLKPGQAVTVTPDDYARVPVVGTLVASDPQQIVIHHADPQAGDLHLHFPRAGFEVAVA